MGDTPSVRTFLESSLFRTWKYELHEDRLEIEHRNVGGDTVCLRIDLAVLRPEYSKSIMTSQDFQAGGWVALLAVGVLAGSSYVAPILDPEGLAWSARAMALIGGGIMLWNWKRIFVATFHYITGPVAFELSGRKLGATEARKFADDIQKAATAHQHSLRATGSLQDPVRPLR